MTSPIASGYSRYHYESPESRALRSVSIPSYERVWNDQSKLLSKIVSDVSYLAAFSRKLERGVDQANQNILEQFTGLFTNILSIMAGHGDTGFDFGDFKYVLQMWGSLFGLFDEEGNLQLPINFFTAAWHFFSNFIGGTGSFLDLINEIVDGIIATVLDIFGEVPILGQALQQLAVIISEIRDLLNIVGGAIQTFFDAFNLDIGDIGGISDLFGPFAPIVDALMNALDGINLPDFTNTFHIIAGWLSPVAEAIARVIGVATAFVKLVTGQGESGDLISSIHDLTSGLDPVGAPDGLEISDIGHGLADIFFRPFRMFLDDDSPINALNIFNVPWLNGLLPLGHLGNVQEINLIDDPHFVGAASIDSSAFVWDGTSTHSVDIDGAGSAKVTADGSTKDLFSNKIPVDPGQKIKVSAWVAWNSLAGTGTPIRLGLTYYLNNAAVATPDLVTRANSPTTSGYTQLTTGDTLVTVPANVDSVAVRLTLSSSATSGTVNWSDLYFSKPAGKIPTGFIDELDDIIDDIHDSLSTAISNLLGKLDASDFQELLNTLGGSFGNAIENIQERLNRFLDNESPLNASNINDGDIGDQFVSGVRNIINNFVSRTRNIPILEDFGQDDLAAAAEANSAAITGIASQVSQLSQTFTDGVTEGDDFERTSSSNLGSGWIIIKSGAGNIATPNGHDASWIASGDDDCEFVCIRNTGNVHSQTNFQDVEIVLASAATTAKGGLLLPTVFGANDIWCRISDATTSFANITGIRYRFWQDGTVSVWRYVNGIGNELTVGDIGLTPGAGSVLGGYAGKAGTARYFEPRLNYRPAIPGISEVGVASGLGAAYTRWGFGGLVKGYNVPFFAGQTLIGSIRQWSAKDQFT